MKVGKKKSKVLVVRYSGALVAGSAESLSDYHLAVLAKGKKGVQSTSRPVTLRSAVYDPGLNTVTLAPLAAIPKGTLQLTINASQILDAQGQPVEGNSEGNVLARFASSRSVSVARVAQAVDALLSRGEH